MRLPSTLAVAVLIVLAGCAGVPSTSSPTDAPPTDASPTDPSPTTGPPAHTEEPWSVQYAVRAGSIPDEFASVTVTLQVVFVEDTSDLGPCYPEIYRGPYEPTLTPLATPAGQCERSETLTVELTALDDSVRLNATAPSWAGGHALLVTDVTATLDNGSTVTTIKGIGGVEVFRERSPPSGPYGAQVGIDPVDDDRWYDYWLIAERWDPNEGSTDG